MIATLALPLLALGAPLVAQTNAPPPAPSIPVDYAKPPQSSQNYPVTPEALADARAIVRQSGFDAQMRQQIGALQPVLASTFLGELSKAPEGVELLNQVDSKLEGGRTAFSNRFAASFRQKFLGKSEQMREHVASIYAQKFSPEDLKAIRAFYESDAGKRALAMQPQLFEAMRSYGEKVGRKAGEEAALETIKQVEQDMKGKQ